MDAAVKPPWMGLRRSSKGPPQPKNHAKNIKLGIAASFRRLIEMSLHKLMAIASKLPEDFSRAPSP